MILWAFFGGAVILVLMLCLLAWGKYGPHN
jgi:hypothetical protein